MGVALGTVLQSHRNQFYFEILGGPGFQES